MLNNSLFYSKSLNADRQNKWCCFDLMLPGKLEKVIDRQNIYNIYQPWPWRWWYQIWSGFCHKTLTFSNPPIMWRWFNHAGYILSQSLWSQNVAVFHSDNWMMSVRKWGSSFDGNQDTRRKQIEEHQNIQTFQWSYLFLTSQYVGVTKPQFSSTMWL